MSPQVPLFRTNQTLYATVRFQLAGHDRPVYACGRFSRLTNKLGRTQDFIPEWLVPGLGIRATCRGTKRPAPISIPHSLAPSVAAIFSKVTCGPNVV